MSAGNASPRVAPSKMLPSGNRRAICDVTFCGPWALSANMSETATPWEFSVEGESGSESDERIGAGPRVSDRGGGEGDAAAVHGGVQTEDRPGGRRLQDAGRGRGVAAA